MMFFLLNTFADHFHRKLLIYNYNPYRKIDHIHQKDLYFSKNDQQKDLIEKKKIK